MCFFVLLCSGNGTNFLCKKDFWLEACFLALAVSESCQREMGGVECSEEVRGMAKEMPTETTALFFKQLLHILP